MYLTYLWLTPSQVDCVISCRVMRVCGSVSFPKLSLSSATSNCHRLTWFCCGGFSMLSLVPTFTDTLYLYGLLASLFLNRVTYYNIHSLLACTTRKRKLHTLSISILQNYWMYALCGHPSCILQNLLNSLCIPQSAEMHFPLSVICWFVHSRGTLHGLLICTLRELADFTFPILPTSTLHYLLRSTGSLHSLLTCTHTTFQPVYCTFYRPVFIRPVVVLLYSAEIQAVSWLLLTGFSCIYLQSFCPLLSL